VSFAASRGVTVVVAASNEDQDLAHVTVDPFSPTDTGSTGPRPVTNDCKLLPVELNGVIAVSAVGYDRNLAYYSNYGLGVIDVTAPGGDLHVPAPGNASGQIASPIPSYSLFYQIANSYNGRIGIGCTDGLDPNDPAADPSTCAETYALLQGTSMSAPHATGVAALAISRFGNMSTGELMARLDHAATPLACPPNPYQPYPADMPALTCESGHFTNGFYGHGEVDALATVRRWW
jgi:subtilisin family serine protease